MGKKARKSSAKSWLLLLIALGVFIVGIGIAAIIDRHGGSTQVQDVYYTSSLDGSLLHGRLFIPQNATSETPAPAVLFMHGNDGDCEKYSAIPNELARRGYVVFNADMRGQGKSLGSTAFTGAFDSLGTDEAAEYLRNLSFVDKDNIMAGGHSMGGIGAIRSAHNHLEWYKGLVLMGVTAADCGVKSDNTNLGPKASDKSAGPQAAEDEKVLPFANDENNINILIVTGRDDGDAFNHSGVAYFCGLESTAEFESGKVYGSYAENNARMNYQTPVIHNLEYLNKGVISVCVDFVQNSMKAPSEIAPDSQIWLWRYFGTSIALFALIAMLLPLGSILLATPFFSTICIQMPEYKGTKGKRWWIFAIVTALVGPALYFFGTSNNITAWLKSEFWNIQRANSTLSWTLIVAGVTIIILVVCWVLTKKADRLTLASAGLAYEKGKNIVSIAKTLLLAFVMVFTIYALLAVQYRWTLVDVRVWNTSFRELNIVRILRVLRYFIPFALSYIVMQVNLFGTLRPASGNLSIAKEVMINVAILSPWYLIWGIWLGPAGLKASAGLPSFAGSMYAFFWAVPFIMAIVAAVSTFFNRKTGRVYLGALISALLVSWTLLGGFSRMV